MRRLCERPGCSQPADANYGIDADRLIVWIEPLDRRSAPTAGVLCRRHADAMVVPNRWSLDDRREPVPRLFRAPAAAVLPLDRRRPARTTSRPDPAPQLDLDAPADDDRADADADGVVTVARDIVAERDGSPADRTELTPWRPVFDQTDDLDGLLQAHGPLLARAFEGRHRRPPNER